MITSLLDSILKHKQHNLQQKADSSTKANNFLQTTCNSKLSSCQSNGRHCLPKHEMSSSTNQMFKIEHSKIIL